MRLGERYTAFTEQLKQKHSWWLALSTESQQWTAQMKVYQGKGRKDLFLHIFPYVTLVEVDSRGAAQQPPPPGSALWVKVTTYPDKKGGVVYRVVGKPFVFITTGGKIVVGELSELNVALVFRPHELLPMLQKVS